MKLTKEVRSGVESTSITSENATVDQIKQAVLSLNGDNISLVYLEEGGATLTIGGGNDGRFIIYAQDEEQMYTLSPGLASEQDEQYLEVVAGGQSGEYPNSLICDELIALSTAIRFLETKTIDRNLNWIT